MHFDNPFIQASSFEWWATLKTHAASSSIFWLAWAFNNFKLLQAKRRQEESRSYPVLRVLISRHRCACFYRSKYYLATVLFKKECRIFPRAFCSFPRVAVAVTQCRNICKIPCTLFCFFVFLPRGVPFAWLTFHHVKLAVLKLQPNRHLPVLPPQDVPSVPVLLRCRSIQSCTRKNALQRAWMPMLGNTGELLTASVFSFAPLSQYATCQRRRGIRTLRHAHDNVLHVFDARRVRK